MQVVKVEFRHRRSWDGLNAYTVTFDDGMTYITEGYDELEVWKRVMDTDFVRSRSQNTGSR